MTRNFGIPKFLSVPLSGDTEATPATSPPPTSGAGVASISLPSGSILAPSAPLERGNLAQALIDVLALLVGFSVVNLIAVSIPVSLFILLFVSFG